MIIVGSIQKDSNAPKYVLFKIWVPKWHCLD